MNICTEFNPSPLYKIWALTKLITFADDKFKFAKNTDIFLG